MSDLIERLRLNKGEVFGPTMHEAADEIERLNKCLQWEQNMAERVGTHGLDCWKWGHQHYECALREIERLQRENEELRADFKEAKEAWEQANEGWAKADHELAALKALSNDEFARAERSEALPLIEEK